MGHGSFWKQLFKIGILRPYDRLFCDFEETPQHIVFECEALMWRKFLNFGIIYAYKTMTEKFDL